MKANFHIKLVCLKNKIKHLSRLDTSDVAAREDFEPIYSRLQYHNFKFKKNNDNLPQSLKRYFCLRLNVLQ